MPETSEYFRTNDAMIVFVVITVTRCSSRIFWKVPASWSAWQCVRMTCVTLRDEMPFLCRYCAEWAGGSTRMPRPRIHKTKPAVVPSDEKPSAAPSTVIPKSGVLNSSSRLGDERCGMRM